jgi:hypothetical protein
MRLRRSDTPPPRLLTMLGMLAIAANGVVLIWQVRRR